MKVFVYSVLCVVCVVFSSCRKEKQVDPKSLYYFYSEDSTRILCDMNRRATSLIGKSDYRDVTTDVENFAVISEEYAKDSECIYYTHISLKNGDIQSFYWDEVNELPKDKNHVYYPVPESGKLKVISYADPETYEKVTPAPVCAGWWRDKNNYFYNHKKTDADRNGLCFESPYLPFDGQYVFSVEKGEVKQQQYAGAMKILTPHLLRDDQRYYFKAACDSVSYSIHYDDREAFEYYDTYYHIFKIDHKVYFMGLPINSGNIDMESFEVVGDGYTKDKNHVYYKDKLLPDSHPQTFEILSKEYAKDKNKVYNLGVILENYEPSTFESDAWGRYPTDSNYGKKPDRKRPARTAGMINK